MKYDEHDLKHAIMRLTVKHGCLVLEVGFQKLIGLIAVTQLGLRHPANNGPSAEQARSVLDDLIQTLEKEEPKLAAFLRLGFNPAFDVKRPFFYNAPKQDKPSPDWVAKGFDVAMQPTGEFDLCFYNDAGQQTTVRIAEHAMQRLPSVAITMLVGSVIGPEFVRALRDNIPWIDKQVAGLLLRVGEKAMGSKEGL